MGVRSKENSLGLYERGSNEILLKGLKKSVLSKLKILWKKEDFKKISQNEFHNKQHEKTMYGQFTREMLEEIDKELYQKWFVQSDLKVKTEATIFSAQKQTLKTNYTKKEIDKTLENPLFRMCGERGKTVQHIISECKTLAQRKYKRTHVTVA